MSTSAGKKVQAQLDRQRKRVDVDHFDLTIKEVVRLAVERELHRAPEYQRLFRWSEVTESQLIESIFLGLPVPSLYVAANEDGTWELVDGLQRVSTLLHFAASEHQFILDEIGKDGPLVLSGLEKVPSLNGLTFDELPAPIQLGFHRRLMRATVLSDKSDYDIRFDLFERLNRGGVELTSQEVRACVYQGPFNSLLRELGSDPGFNGLLKLQRKQQNDATKEELVLKFFAYLNGRDEFDGAVTDFLNDYMKAASSDIDVDDAREEFLTVVAALTEISGGEPLLRSNYSSTPLNQFEAVMVGAAEVLRANDNLGTPATDWLDDEKLVQASTKGTNTKAQLRRRIERTIELLSP